MDVRSALRVAATSLLRPVPVSALVRAAQWRAPVGPIARQGLRGRTVTIARGEAQGLRLDAGPSNLEYVFGTNEPPVQAAIVDALRPGGVFYDIGANIGYMTVLAARCVGPDGFVVAFEPFPGNADLVRSNAEANGFGNVLVVCRAASDVTGVTSLQVTAASGGHTLESAGPPPDRIGTVLVETTTVDDFVATSGVRPPDVVKIDVEGVEPEVLKGMARTLAEHRPVLVIEVDDATWERHDARQAVVEEFLRDRNYVLERLPDSYAAHDWVVSHRVARPA